MLLIFQRFHRELCLGLLVLFGLACGQLVSTILEVKLRSQSLPHAETASASRTPARQQAQSDLNFILQRNLFDPASRGDRTLTLTPEAAQGNQSAIPRKNLTLYGTLVAGADSVALIMIDKEVKGYHLDEQFPDGGRIETIERNRVTIRYPDQSTTTLNLHEALPGRQTTQRSETAVDGIQPVGPNHWKVARSTAEAARENIGEQLRLAQMEPRLINGQTNGFLVRMLNPRSLLTKMGLQRGDVVLQVNEMQLDSPEKALQIMQQLREARQITVNIERGRKPMTFTYELE